MGPYKMGLLLLISISFITSINAYIAENVKGIEKPLLVIRDYPNYANENISQFRPVNFRIDPDKIRMFNASTTMLTVEMWVDEDTPSAFPVFVSLIQKHEKISLQLPQLFHLAKGPPVRYIFASRTLCFPEQKLDTEKGHILISVTSGSSQMIGFHLKVLVSDFQLQLGKIRTMSLSPTTPRFWRIPFFNEASQNLVIKVSSNNDHCMVLGIQKLTCPVFTSDGDFLANNDVKEVVTRNGAIRVDMRNYLNGLYFQIAMFPDDSKCGRNPESVYRRQKEIMIVVESDTPISLSNGHFWLQISIPPILSLVVGILIGALYLITYSCSKRRIMSCRTYNVNKSENESVSVRQFTPTKNTESSNYGTWILVLLFLHAPIIQQAVYDFQNSDNCSYNSLCSHPFWIFKDFNHVWSNVSYLVLGLSFILVASVKKLMQRTSDQEEGIQFCVGLYYAMGLSLISHGILSFAYHICPSKFSFQYDTLYLAVLIVICQLKISEFRRPNTFSIRFSGIAIALIIVLLILGVEAERHLGDLNLAFFVFRIVVAVIQGFFIFYASVYAIYIGYPINRFPKKAELDEIPLQQPRILADLRPQQPINVSASRSNPNQEVFMKSFGDIPIFMWIFPKIWEWKLPKFRFERLVYVLLLLGCNGCLIYLSLSINYCFYVFAFVGANFGLNLLYYIIMKIVVGEFSCRWKSFQVFVYLALALLTGTAAGYFFLQNLSEWSNPGVHHRINDKQCTWLMPYPFFDKHDFWHILSAHTFFFLFMILLAIDDGVEGVNREYLLVF